MSTDGTVYATHLTAMKKVEERDLRVQVPNVAKVSGVMASKAAPITIFCFHPSNSPLNLHLLCPAHMYPSSSSAYVVFVRGAAL